MKLPVVIKALVFSLLALIPLASGIAADNAAGSAQSTHSKYVFAHYMVCCATSGISPTVADFQKEIREAQSRGIDGFALNCGGWKKKWPFCRTRILEMYQAADSLATGFKLFVSIDAFGGGDAPDEIADIVATTNKFQSQFRYSGKPVLSTFSGEARGADLIQKAHAAGAFFVPYFLPARFSSQIQQFHVNQLTSDYGSADGYFFFGGAGTPEQLSSSSEILASGWKQRGRIFMASVSPFYRGRGPNYRVFESSGFEGMKEAWEAAITSNADWVELTTWNDWNESTYVAPFGSPEQTSMWNGIWAKTMLSHVAYLDASRYYIDWFKRGTPPKITQDSLYYFYRLYSKSLPIPADQSVKIHCTAGRPQGADQLKDNVFVTAFLSSPADLTISSGKQQQSFHLNAGVNNVQLPFGPGNQHFILTRNNAVILDKVGEQPVSDNDVSSCFNYFSGGAIAVH